jgi:hypothetical protein
MLSDEIKKGGTTVEIKLYLGEGHIFMKAETLQGMELAREAWFRRHLIRANIARPSMVAVSSSKQGCSELLLVCYRGFGTTVGHRRAMPMAGSLSF